MVGAEPTVARLPRQPRELGLPHVDERGVVAPLEIHLRLMKQLVLDNDVEPIAFADRRNGAALAIRDQLVQLKLGCEGEPLPEQRLEAIELEAPGGRQD